MARTDRSLSTTCKAFEEDLVLFYYGELTGTDRNKIDTHVHDCQSCALYIKELATLLPMTAEADEPLPVFWDNYSREMRHKLDEISERKWWWQTLPTLFQSWTLPAFATAAVVVLALSLTFGTAVWRDNEVPGDEEGFMEVLPMADAENLEFFRTMEVLDALDLLEYLGNNPSGAA
jgi:predicted anti-sigma-YlaC factor YlaD